MKESTKNFVLCTQQYSFFVTAQSTVIELTLTGLSFTIMRLQKDVSIVEYDNCQISKHKPILAFVLFSVKKIDRMRRVVLVPVCTEVS